MVQHQPSFVLQRLSPSLEGTQASHYSSVLKTKRIRRFAGKQGKKLRNRVPSQSLRMSGRHTHDTCVSARRTDQGRIELWRRTSLHEQPSATSWYIVVMCN